MVELVTIRNWKSSKLRWHFNRLGFQLEWDRFSLLLTRHSAQRSTNHSIVRPARRRNCVVCLLEWQHGIFTEEWYNSKGETIPNKRENPINRIFRFLVDYDNDALTKTTTTTRLSLRGSSAALLWRGEEDFEYMVVLRDEIRSGRLS